MPNVLEKIINQKKIDLITFKKKYTNSFLSELIKQNKSYINFMFINFFFANFL